ncbi:MAG TPA: hypothetical protein VNT53_09460 [Pseudolysinimonas sp.]|nr:hypothetical protein [Pseudolysinimonas sp.]
MTQLNSRTKKIAIVAITLALVLGGGGIAFAYWTSSGTGTGVATTGTSTGLTVTSSAPTGSALSPGGPTQTVAFSVNNPGTGSQAVTSVVVSVASAGGAAWTAIPGCSASDYSLGTPTITYGTIAGGGSLLGSVTVTMVALGTDQDACQGVTVPLYFVAS